jgi:hypothetical protein
MDEDEEDVSDVGETEEVGAGCLEGMCCPKCKQCERFKIDGRATFEVVEDGSEVVGDHEWDEDSGAHCPKCDWRGKVRDLYSKS